MSAARRLRRLRRVPNYVLKAEALARQFPPQPGSVTRVGVFHEDRCAVHRGRPCDCDCDVRYLDAPAPAGAN